MIASKDSFEPHSSDQLPNSKKIYVAGKIHPEVRVPMREIQLAPTKSFNGRTETNEPVRVYEAATDSQEAGWIVEEIRALINTGLSRSEIAVLYRSNAQSRTIEHTLVNVGIPYRVYGGLRFF